MSENKYRKIYRFCLNNNLNEIMKVVLLFIIVIDFKLKNKINRKFVKFIYLKLVWLNGKVCYVFGYED